MNVTCVESVVGYLLLVPIIYYFGLEMLSAFKIKITETTSYIKGKFNLSYLWWNDITEIKCKFKTLPIIESCCLKFDQVLAEAGARPHENKSE